MTFSFKQWQESMTLVVDPRSCDRVLCYGEDIYPEALPSAQDWFDMTHRCQHLKFKAEFFEQELTEAGYSTIKIIDPTDSNAGEGLFCVTIANKSEVFLHLEVAETFLWNEYVQPNFLSKSAPGVYGIELRRTIKQTLVMHVAASNVEKAKAIALARNVNATSDYWHDGDVLNVEAIVVEDWE